MSGHSKWATTKHKKCLLDAKRGKLFTKVVREISSAVKQGGNDPSSNPRLRLAIQNAKAVSMPKDNIERALNKKDDTDYTNIIYEGNGPYGSVFIIECLTDNANRTVGELRTLFNRSGGALGKTGSVGYNFDRKSIFAVAKNDVCDAGSLLLDGIEHGLEDIDEAEDSMCIIGMYDSFGTIQTFLENNKITIIESGIKYIPKSYITLNDEDYEKIVSFIELLEDNDDVQNVYYNIEIK